MEADPFLAHVAAALDGLREVPLAKLQPAALLIALAVIGDALRARTSIPTPVLRAAEALPEDAFRAAFGALRREIASWSLASAPIEQDDPAYDWAVRQRDQAESVLMTARRFLTPRGVLVNDLAEGRALLETLDGLDFKCGRTRSYADALEALGDRRPLAAHGFWLKEDEPAAEEATGSETAFTEELPFVSPADASVERYITRGELARYIEGSAARSPEFAEELEAMIEAGRDCGSTVGLAARRWLKDHQRRSTSVDLSSHQRAAAGEEAPIEVLELGLLPPIDAVASLTIGKQLTIKVFPSATTKLTSVRFNKGEARVDEHGDWSVTIDHAPGELELRVESATGEVFEVPLRLDPEP
jgi:hypothetical protein